MPVIFFNVPALLFMLFAPTLLEAAAAKRVDDASITPKGECQLDAWLGSSGKSHELVALPVCGVTDRTDIILGYERVDPHNEPHESALAWQVKSRLTTPEKSFQAAMALGGSVNLNRQDDDRKLRDVFVNLPISYFAGEATELRLNVGMLRDLDDRDWQMTSGLGVVQEINDNVAAFAEAFWTDFRGDQYERGWQAGVLFPDVTERLDLNLTVLNSRPDTQRRYSLLLGFTLNFFP